MKQVGGVWLPDSEQHLVAWMQKVNKRVDGKLTYQFHKLEAALKYVTSWRTAVDVGAHCGLWSMHLVKRFDAVIAFEPVAEHRECFTQNVPDRAVLVPCAVGEKAGSVAMKNAGVSTGDIHIDPVNPPGEVEMVTLDGYDLLKDEPVDFIKLDVEGFELFALRGAEKLLRRCKPVIIVEQKPGRAEKYGLPRTGAVDYLQSLGYTLQATLSGDYILTAA